MRDIVLATRRARVLATTTPFKIRSLQQKRERSAERRIQPMPRLRRQVYAVCATHLLRGSAHFGRARLPALCCGSRQGERIRR
jgi:hypothetical protein